MNHCFKNIKFGSDRNMHFLSFYSNADNFGLLMVGLMSE